jgi:hypothetical protein
MDGNRYQEALNFRSQYVEVITDLTRADRDRWFSVTGHEEPEHRVVVGMKRDWHGNPLKAARVNELLQAAIWNVRGVILNEALRIVKEQERKVCQVAVEEARMIIVLAGAEPVEPAAEP